MTESNRHQRYKEKVKYALIKAGWQEVYEEGLRTIKTENWPGREELGYRIDVYAEKEGIKLGIEVDNPGRGGGHRSSRERTKDRVRSRELFKQHGILMLRLEFWQLKDLKNFDEEIIREINHEIWRYIPSFSG